MDTAELPAPPLPDIDLAGFFTEIFQDESISSLERDLNMIRAAFEHTKDPRQQDHLKKMLRKALAELDRVLEV